MPKRRVARRDVEQPLDSSYRLIPLTQGKVALVDLEDYESLSTIDWCAAKARKTFYAVGRIEGRQIAMHRFILGSPIDLFVDHRSGDGLDNRRQNLRACTIQQNLLNAGPAFDNKLGFKGVASHKGKFQATIGFKGKQIYLGRTDTPEGAARLYDAAAARLFGQFAFLNFPLVHSPE